MKFCVFIVFTFLFSCFSEPESKKEVIFVNEVESKLYDLQNNRDKLAYELWYLNDMLYNKEKETLLELILEIEKAKEPVFGRSSLDRENSLLSLNSKLLECRERCDFYKREADKYHKYAF